MYRYKSKDHSNFVLVNDWKFEKLEHIRFFKVEQKLNLGLLENTTLNEYREKAEAVVLTLRIILLRLPHGWISSRLGGNKCVLAASHSVGSAGMFH